MPELAELKLTSDFINKSSQGLIFKNISKNPNHKGNEMISPYDNFTVSSKSRGKELLITLADINTNHTTSILMTMGMSGFFSILNGNNLHKHSHLNFNTVCNKTLSFIDVRRFGKWKWANDWSSNRGPDPTTDHELFKKNILENLHKPEFSKPIHLVLMNQKYANGIGNYLRAEILYRSDTNPFSMARQVFTSKPAVFDLCRDIPLTVYTLGGGQFKDWQNPFGNDKEELLNFIKCYGNTSMNTIKDVNGRTLWYDPKWDKFLNM